MRHVPAILLVLVAALCAIIARAAEPPTLTERIARVLLAQQRHVSDVDEDPRAREARLREVAASVSSAVQHATCAGAWARPTPCRRIWPGSQLELAAALLALGWHETHWASAVQSGECHRLGRLACDRGKARGPWQLWEQSCPVAWSHPAGSADELRAGAWCAARLLSGAVRFCDGDLAGAFGRYAGRSCRWAGGGKRVVTMRRILNDLQRNSPAPAPEPPVPAETASTR